MKIARHCSGGRHLKLKMAVIAIVVLVALIAVAPVWASSTEGGHGGGWQATDWYRVMNFAVLAIGLFIVLKKPASQALNSRIKGIAQELEDLETRKRSVEKQLAEYNDRLAKLDKEGEQIVAEYIRQGKEAKTRILKEAETAAEKLKEQAHKNIEHEFKQARVKLQQHVVEKALTRAEQLIKEKISADDQNRLVDEYLDKVVA
ncbi:MAG: ATP synthase F0 subunit B [Desulfatitalea sp.]|nr:ATP synthase F0 subunit B [Desulfatitalea sp.]